MGLVTKLRMPRVDEAIAGRDAEIPVLESHFVTDNPMKPPFPGKQMAIFAMGCFWGAERIFWQTDGVFSTQVGYAGGFTRNPTYQEVCSGMTGHTEVVRVVFDSALVTYARLLQIFWENHDPSQGMRQGNDIGTQYRSAIYCFDDGQRAQAEGSRSVYSKALLSAGHAEITTEIAAAPTFYYAEEYHQQYLAKNPGGYCGLGGTGVSCPVPTGVTIGKGAGS